MSQNTPLMSPGPSYMKLLEDLRKHDLNSSVVEMNDAFIEEDEESDEENTTSFWSDATLSSENTKWLQEKIPEKATVVV